MPSSILGLRTTIYKVSDLAAAKEWYSKAFSAEPYFDEPYYVGFNIGGYELGLQPEEVQVGENVATFWGVEDIQKEYEWFLACGAVPVEAPMNVGGEIMVATVKDSWGNLIGLIYNPEFKGFIPVPTSSEFTNELGNAISVSVEALDTDGVPGVFISMRGPDSSTTNHITRQEAAVLLGGLKKVLGEG